jgi:tripartite-type tricarboxylate transporter receptor subunit TctC
MMTRRHLLTASAAGLAFSTTGLVPQGIAQLRERTARILIGFAAGGTPYVMARLIANEMRNYAPAIIVEARPGASGRIAVEAVKAAAPDGSVILFAPIGFMTLFPHVYKKLKYRPLQDFIPVSTVASSPSLLTVGPKVPGDIRTLADFIVWCRANPEQATYGSPGTGTSLHFDGFMFGRAAGFEFLHVPYQGGAPVQDILKGEIASTILPIDSTLAYIRSGALRALATIGPQRSPFLPDVPTMTEAGYPSLEDIAWYGFFVSAKTPADIVEKLNRAIHEALSTDVVKSGMARLSVEISAVQMGDFTRLIASQSERWAAIVRASGFTPLD